MRRMPVILSTILVVLVLSPEIARSEEHSELITQAAIQYAKQKSNVLVKSKASLTEITRSVSQGANKAVQREEARLEEIRNTKIAYGQQTDAEQLIFANTRDKSKALRESTARVDAAKKVRGRLVKNGAESLRVEELASVLAAQNTDQLLGEIEGVFVDRAKYTLDDIRSLHAEIAAIEKGEFIPTLTINRSELSGFGKFPLPARCLQVSDATNARIELLKPKQGYNTSEPDRLITVTDADGEPIIEGTVCDFWLRGVPTNNLHDGKEFKTAATFLVFGTYTYATAARSQRTVPLVVPVDLAKVRERAKELTAGRTQPVPE